MFESCYNTHWLVARGSKQSQRSARYGRITVAKAGMGATPLSTERRHRSVSGADPMPTPNAVSITMSVHLTHHCPLSQQRGQVNCRQRGPSMRRFRRGYARHRYWTQEQGSVRHDAEQHCMLVVDVGRLWYPLVSTRATDQTSTSCVSSSRRSDLV